MSYQNKVILGKISGKYKDETIEIEIGTTPADTKIKLGGRDVSNVSTRVRIDCNPRTGKNTVTIEMIPQLFG